MNAPATIPPRGRARAKHLIAFAARRPLTERETDEFEDLKFRLFLANQRKAR